MRVKFQADANLDERIVQGLRRRESAIDFRTAHAALLSGLPDPKVLAIAADSGRILVTQDRRTMMAHFRRFIQAQTSSGVVLVRRGASLAAVIGDLHLIWDASDADEWSNQIAWIPM